MATKRTYQPSRSSVPVRTASWFTQPHQGGRRVLARRRAKGRHVLAL